MAQVPRKITVAELKNSVALATSISTESQRLLLSGNEMDNSKTLGEYCKPNCSSQVSFRDVYRTLHAP
jgi:hypothetical protein